MILMVEVIEFIVKKILKNQLFIKKTLVLKKLKSFSVELKRININLINL